MSSQLYSIAPIVLAEEQHLLDVKRITDQHKRELGFVNREILRKAISTQSLLIAPIEQSTNGSMVVGILHFYQRRDHILTLYSIAVEEAYRGLGIGRLLVEELIHIGRIHGKTFIRLKCPIELPANNFYKKLGFELLEVEQGKQRRLNIWHFEINK